MSARTLGEGKHQQQLDRLPKILAAATIMGFHYGFIEDAERFDFTPTPVSDVLLIHGVDDETVPIETSREWARVHSERVDLVEVRDGHRLSESVDEIIQRAMTFFGVE